MTLLEKLSEVMQGKQTIPGYQGSQQLGTLSNVVGEAKTEPKPLTSVLTENTKPVGSLGAAKQPVLAARTATQTPVSYPMRSVDKPAPVPQKTQTFSSIPSNKLAKPFSKMAFARNTGIVDVDGDAFVNDEDAELLGKLGFDMSVDEYIELEKTSEVYDLYSYIEKIAGVPKAVSKAVDKGEAFSGSLLKDMGYSVPKGYEVKGDLCCPLEKAEKKEKRTSEKTASEEDYVFTHYNPHGKHKELRPLTYLELLKDRSRGRWENKPELAQKYVDDRKEFEATLGKELLEADLPYDSEKSFLYGAVDGHERFGQPGAYQHLANMPDLDKTFFTINGLDDKDHIGRGKQGLLNTIKLWKENQDKLKDTEYMGMTIRPRVEIMTQEGVTPHTIKRLKEKTANAQDNPNGFQQRMSNVKQNSGNMLNSMRQGFNKARNVVAPKQDTMMHPELSVVDSLHQGFNNIKNKFAPVPVSTVGVSPPTTPAPMPTRASAIGAGSELANIPLSNMTPKQTWESQLQNIMGKKPVFDLHKTPLAKNENDVNWAGLESGPKQAPNQINIADEHVKDLLKANNPAYEEPGYREPTSFHYNINAQDTDAHNRHIAELSSHMQKYDPAWGSSFRTPVPAFQQIPEETSVDVAAAARNNEQVDSLEDNKNKFKSQFEGSLKNRANPPASNPTQYPITDPVQISPADKQGEATHELDKKAMSLGGISKSIVKAAPAKQIFGATHFKDPNLFYRVVHGNNAFQDILDSGLVRTNFNSKPKVPGGISLENRPTLWPSFSKGEASMSYAQSNPEHYIITSADPSLKPSTRGRHGMGKTMFPTDEHGNHLPSLDASKVQIYKHIGDEQYELLNHLLRNAQKTAAEGKPGLLEKESVEKPVKERVRVIIPYEGKYILERLKNPKYPDNLDKRRHIGGGIEKGETPIQAAVRELHEELGIKADHDAFTHVGKIDNQHYLLLKNHNIKPGKYKASVGSDPFIHLEHGMPGGHDYMGPDIHNMVKKSAADPSQTILLTGHSGSGKTTLSKLLSEKLNIPVHRVDAQESWDAWRDSVKDRPDYEKKTLQHGTAENKHYNKIVKQVLGKALKSINGPAILEGTQVTSLSPKALEKFKAHVYVGGPLEQSFKQRMARAEQKALQKGQPLTEEDKNRRHEEAKSIAGYWEPGMEKFKKIPGAIQYNHTEHQVEPLIKRLQSMLQKKAEYGNTLTPNTTPNLSTNIQPTPIGVNQDVSNIYGAGDTPYGRPTVENPYPGIIGDAGVNALEAGAIYGANRMRNNSVQAALGKGSASVPFASLLNQARMWGNIGRAVPAAGAAAQASGAYDRYKKQDYLGSAIDGIGAIGSAAQLAPHPVAKGVGLGVSVASTVANAGRDIHRYNNRPVEFRRDPAILSNPSESNPVEFRHDPAILSNPSESNPVQIPINPLAKSGEATHELIKEAIGNRSVTRIFNLLKTTPLEKRKAILTKLEAHTIKHQPAVEKNLSASLLSPRNVTKENLRDRLFPSKSNDNLRVNTNIGTDKLLGVYDTSKNFTDLTFTPRFSTINELERKAYVKSNARNLTLGADELHEALISSDNARRHTITPEAILVPTHPSTPGAVDASTLSKDKSKVYKGVGQGVLQLENMHNLVNQKFELPKPSLLDKIKRFITPKDRREWLSAPGSRYFVSGDPGAAAHYADNNATHWLPISPKVYRSGVLEAKSKANWGELLPAPEKKAEATHELKSSNIKAVGYDKKDKALEVHFHSGGEYKYSDVPASLFHRLLKVKSPGKFFHKHIKKDNPFEYERLNKEKEAAENVVSPHNSIGNIRDNMDNMTGTAISNAAKYTTDKFVKPYVQAHPEQVKALSRKYVPKAINATIEHGPSVVENLNKVEPVLGNVGDKLISPVRSIMPAMEQAGKMVSPPLNIAENIIKSPQIDSAISNATGSLSAPVNPSFKKSVGKGVNTIIFNTALQKMIPGAGGILSAVSASERAAKGDRLGAYIDRVAAVASGVAPIPYTWPIAIPVSIGANLTNMSRDIYNSNADKYKKFLEAPRVHQ